MWTRWRMRKKFIVHCDVQEHHSNRRGLPAECLTNTILCATWTLEFTMHAKETGKSCPCKDGFQIFMDMQPIISVLCQYHWKSNELMLSLLLHCVQESGQARPMTGVTAAGFSSLAKGTWYSVLFMSILITYTMHMSIFSSCYVINVRSFCAGEYAILNFHLAGQQFDPFNQSSATRGLPQPTEKLEER